MLKENEARRGEALALLCLEWGKIKECLLLRRKREACRRGDEVYAFVFKLYFLLLFFYFKLQAWLLHRFLLLCCCSARVLLLRCPFLTFSSWFHRCGYIFFTDCSHCWWVFKQRFWFPFCLLNRKKTIYLIFL